MTHYVKLAAEAVDFYSEFFGIPYPLSKLDLVSLHSMPVRAMENWGCITFDRAVLLTAEAHSERKLVQRNARTVTHEVAHMWFGNLVTLKWWDDIWLNEGFARFAEHHILHELRPEYQCWEKYYSMVYDVAMDKDTDFGSTHPVQLTVPSADKLMDIFDTITYAKGSILCRMLADFTGESFTECLKAYMHKYQFRNATSGDLFAVCDEVAGKRHGMLPSEFMMPWLTHASFPLLEIEYSLTPNGKYAYKLTQRPITEQDKFVWPLLVNTINADGNENQFLMTDETP